MNQYTLEQINNIFTKVYGNADWNLFVACLFNQLSSQFDNEAAKKAINNLVQSTFIQVISEQLKEMEEIPA